jgi:hypothetical protein
MILIPHKFSFNPFIVFDFQFLLTGFIHPMRRIERLWVLYRHLGGELDVKNWVLELDIKS